MPTLSLKFKNPQAGPARLEAVVNSAPKHAKRGLMRASTVLAETMQTHASGRPGPEIVSGTLHGSIKAGQVRGTGSSYSVRTIVDDVPGKVRALELGHPRWEPGTKYPFIEPALKEMRGGTFHTIMTGSMREMVHDTQTGSFS